MSSSSPTNAPHTHFPTTQNPYHPSPPLSPQKQKYLHPSPQNIQIVQYPPSPYQQSQFHQSHPHHTQQQQQLHPLRQQIDSESSDTESEVTVIKGERELIDDCEKSRGNGDGDGNEREGRRGRLICLGFCFLTITTIIIIILISHFVGDVKTTDKNQEVDARDFGEWE